MTVARHLRLIDTTAQPDDTAAAVGLRLFTTGGTCAPVLDRTGRLLGLVTANDLACTGCDPKTTPVRALMQRHVETILLDAPATQALARMRERRTQLLLVVDERRTLYGTVWLYDLAEGVLGRFGELEDRHQNDGDETSQHDERAGEAVLLQRRGTAVHFAMQALREARDGKPTEASKATSALEPVRRCRRHICRGRWCRGGPSCERVYGTFQPGA